MKNRARNRFRNRTPDRTRTTYQIQNQIQRSLYSAFVVYFQDLHLHRHLGDAPDSRTAGAGA